MRLQRVYPVLGLSVTSRRVVLEGDICFSFSFFCTFEKALHKTRVDDEKRERDPKKEGDKNFFCSLFCVGKQIFLLFRIAVGFARVPASSLSSIDGDSMLIDTFLKAQRSVY